MKREELDESKLFKKEIESHSSQLTNQRIDNLILTTTIKMYDTLTNKPDGRISIELYASILSWFLSTHPLYSSSSNEEISKEINNSIKNANEIMFKIWETGLGTLEEISVLNRYSLRLFYLMTQGMQNLRHLWRVGSQEIKGIDAALELFKLDIWKPKKLEAKA